MALKSPMMPSPTGSGLVSAFSPYSASPQSPQDHLGAFRSDGRSSGAHSDSLAPPSSPYPQQIEPSPVDSNGTENTDIEEGEQENGSENVLPAFSSHDLNSPDTEIISPQSDRPARIDTKTAARPRTNSAEDGPQSVIHAPPGFKAFGERTSAHTLSSPGEDVAFSPGVESPSTPEAIPLGEEETPNAMLGRVTTELPKSTERDRGTPHAQTRHEAEAESKRKAKRRSVLHGIPEGYAKENQAEDEHASGESTNTSSLSQVQDALGTAEEEVSSLRTALSECWTLCNTLANLSSSHRQRTFKFSGMQQVQEQAWRTCWRLCQELYDSRDSYDPSQIMPTLELCREFCQALFDARQKVDEEADSVLRVSFELNNHLYNTHDRSLPEAFNERTLDFYVTLCHRLMRQRTSLPHETDALLRACWSLAEMLFNLRQSNRDAKTPDEDLLGSAVQACWELCDLFREGWTQIRPERNTPRPSQTTFGSKGLGDSSSTRSDALSKSSLGSRQYHDARSFPPETPTTIFDDTATTTSSPDSVSVPNILVLGPSKPNKSSVHTVDSHHDRWTSSASVLSYSSSTSSQHTSSTATAEDEPSHLTRLRYLLLKAGINTGYERNSGQQLTAHVNKLPDTAFGTLPWQMKVLTYYKKLVLGDKSMLSVHNLPVRSLSASEAAKSVRWLGDSAQWAWMRDLFRLVFGFGIDDADHLGTVITV